MQAEIDDLAASVPLICSALEGLPFVQHLCLAAIAYTDFFPQSQDGNLIRALPFTHHHDDVQVRIK